VRPFCLESLQRGHLVDAGDGAGRLELVAHGAVDGTVDGGGAVDGDDVRIVDPGSGRVQPAGVIGEVWTRGPSVAAGPWHTDPGRGPVFPATTARDEHGFLRTGDLGAVHDGELYIVGKLDERLVIGDRTIHPGAVERQVRRLGGLLAREVHRVFTVPLPGRGIAVVLELDGDTADPGVAARLRSAARARLVGCFGLPVADVVIVPCGTLCGLSGGGLSHELMRRLFAADALGPLLQDPGAAAAPARCGVSTEPLLDLRR
jgi:acyl-CoA synthetase (AMP-forming)/AMP-acid ligase II